MKSVLAHLSSILTLGEGPSPAFSLLQGQGRILKAAQASCSLELEEVNSTLCLRLRDPRAGHSRFLMHNTVLTCCLPLSSAQLHFNPSKAKFESTKAP